MTDAQRDALYDVNEAARRFMAAELQVDRMHSRGSIGEYSDAMCSRDQALQDLRDVLSRTGPAILR